MLLSLESRIYSVGFPTILILILRIIIVRVMEQPQLGNGGAEAVLNLEPSSSISIAYHSLFGPHADLILLELDEKLLPDILQQR